MQSVNKLYEQKQTSLSSSYLVNKAVTKKMEREGNLVTNTSGFLTSIIRSIYPANSWSEQLYK